VIAQPTSFQAVAWRADRAMLGHSDRSGSQNTSWNAAYLSQGCTK
jgi:hypothetical protein